jgi:drug/metabolite transporter (DMT)-like permease
VTVTAPRGSAAVAAREPTRAELLRGTLFVLIAGCCFGSIAPLTIIARRNGATVQAVQSWRYVTAALLLIAIGAFIERRGKLHVEIPGAVHSSGQAKRRWFHPLILFVAGCGQSIVATLSLFALDYITAATAVFLFYTYPMWVAIITAVRGIERLTGLRMAALGIALVGIAAMVGAPSAAGMHPGGVALSLTAALIYAAYIPVLGILQHGREPLDVARAISTGGAVLFVLWALLSGGLWNGLGTTELLASVGQGVLSAGAFLGFLGGLRVLGPVRTAITSTIEPFWTTLLGAMVLGQPAGGGTVIGGAAIIIAVVLLQLKRRPVLKS